MGINMHKELEVLGGVHTPTISDFWTWVSNAFTPSYQSEIENYLKDSVDHNDLESRMTSLKRRGLL